MPPYVHPVVYTTLSPYVHPVVYTTLYMPPCVPWWYTLLYMPPVYPGGIPGFIPLLRWVVYTRVVYTSLLGFVGETRTRSGPETAPFTRFTVGHTLVSHSSAHLSTFSQRLVKAGPNGAPESPYPFHCWSIISSLGERYPPWYTHPGTPWAICPAPSTVCT